MRSSVGLALLALVALSCTADPTLVAPPSSGGDGGSKVNDSVQKPDVPVVLPDAGPVGPGADTGDTTLPKTDPGAVPDVVVGDYGKPCKTADDCEGGLCLEGGAGAVCSASCVAACPTGFECKQVKVASADITLACVPKAPNLCKPCTANEQCRPSYLTSALDFCLASGTAGSFCASACTDGTCPDGYTCAKKTLPGATVLELCVPKDEALCTCKPEWAALGLETTCGSANEFGVCTGKRVCGAAGLTACSAKVPAPESCNGLDDDCNGKTDDIGAPTCQQQNGFGTCFGKKTCDGGKEACTAAEPKAEVCNKVDDDCDGETDEGTCADGIACTDDVCQDDGKCSNPIAKDACFIEGSCHAAGAAKGTEACLQCLPAVSQSAFSNAEGKACDDLAACTKNDVCTGGSCLGTSYACSDGLDCTTDGCDGKGGCVYTPSPGTCAIGTACYSDQAPNPLNQCEACSPATDPKGWTPRDGQGCDDGALCTKSDTCDGTSCKGIGYVCDDQNPCTANDCKGDGTCAHPPTAEGAACDDQSLCSTGDKCTGGTCTGAVYSCDDGKGCTADACDGLGGCSHKPILEGEACNDGDACTVNDVCNAGGCAGKPKDCSKLDGACTTGTCNGSGACEATPKGGGCDDGDPCTKNDACSNGACQGTPLDCSQLSNQCTEGYCAAGQCAKKLLTGACDDGDACTVGDACKAGSCLGSQKDCSNVADQCNDGVCSGGACTKQPLGGACNDGDACTTNDTCSNGQCSGTAKNCSQFDGQCTKGVCNGGTCQSQQLSGACSDGDPCTVGDTCIGGSCIASEKDCSSQDDQCNTGYCNNGTCAKQPKSGGCNDNDSCTTNDTCQNGQCSGTTKNCSALNDQCNNGVCQSGTCVKSAKTGSCTDGDSCTTGDKCVGGTCVGTVVSCTNLNDQCNTGECVGGSCQKKAKTGVSCNDNETCTTGDVCSSSGVCAGTPKKDSYEPNDTPATGHLTDITDCANLDYTMSATLYPSGDVDWFWFKDTDSFGCDVEPKVTLDMPAGTNYQLCATYECAANTTKPSINCINGSAWTGPNGQPGCCSTSSGTTSETVRFGPDCSGTDETGYVDIYVYRATGSGLSCSSYTLKWGDS